MTAYCSLFRRLNPKLRLATKQQTNSFGKPLVGIALASYQPDLQTFASQLRSIQEQKYDRFICHVSLDSPVDLAGPSFDRFRGDKRFHFSMNKSRLGLKQNFLAAAMKCKSDGAQFVAFADQDDIWYPEKLSVLIASMKGLPKLSLVHSNMHIFATDPELEFKAALADAWTVERRVFDGYGPILFTVRNTVTGAACLFDAELLDETHECPEEIIYHDQWLAILASARGEVRAIPEKLYAYRQHSQNVVGILKFEGMLHRRNGLSWHDGFQNLKVNWRVTRLTFTQLLPLYSLHSPTQAFVLKLAIANDHLASIYLLHLTAYHLLFDPTLARAFLAKSIGAAMSDAQVI